MKHKFREIMSTTIETRKEVLKEHHLILQAGQVEIAGKITKILTL